MKGIKINKTKDTFEMKIRWWNHYNQSFIEITNDADGEGIGFGFFILISYFLNKTEICSKNSRLTIKHRPLDLLPNTYYEWSKVKFFFVAQKKDGNKEEHGLYAELINGEVQLLIFDFKEDTLYLIEKELNILLEKNNKHK